MKFICAVILFTCIIHSGVNAQPSWTEIVLTPDTGVANVVTALLAANDGYIYAGTATGTAFRFKGQMREELGLIASGGIPNVNSIVEAGGGVFLARVGNGLHRSTDNGLSWNAGPHLGPSSIVANLRGDVMLANGYGARAFRSSDRGESWTDVSSGLPVGISSANLACLAMNRYGTIAMGTPVGLYIYDSAQHTWGSVDKDSTELWEITLTDNGSVYGLSREGILLSEDSGASWKPILSIATGEIVMGLVLDSLQGIVVTIMAFEANVEQSRVLRSSDRGASWSPLHTGLADPRVIAIASGPFGHLYVSAMDGLLYELRLETAAINEFDSHNFDMTVTPNLR